ncbi:hypothetical protein VUR80DRAFT_10186 [Thermomyces stellatus]
MAGDRGRLPLEARRCHILSQSGPRFESCALCHDGYQARTTHAAGHDPITASGPRKNPPPCVARRSLTDLPFPCAVTRSLHIACPLLHGTVSIGNAEVIPHVWVYIHPPPKRSLHHLAMMYVGDKWGPTWIIYSTLQVNEPEYCLRYYACPRILNSDEPYTPVRPRPPALPNLMYAVPNNT